MPRTTSAKKALRQSKRRKAQNLEKKEAHKTAAKAYKKLVAAKNYDGAKAQLSKVCQALDKAAKAGVVKKNKAARLKSRLAQLIVKSSKASS